jgi:hypothetical protein
MNSWGNDRLEEKIDAMLVSSVSKGSEPSDFRVRFMPRMPVFPWLTVLYVLTAALILGFLMAQWFQGQNLESIDYASVFSIERVSDLFSGMGSGGLISTLAVILGLGGAIMAFLPEKLRLLRHML